MGRLLQQDPITALEGRRYAAIAHELAALHQHPEAPTEGHATSGYTWVGRTDPAFKDRPIKVIVGIGGTHNGISKAYAQAVETAAILQATAPGDVEVIPWVYGGRDMDSPRELRLFADRISWHDNRPDTRIIAVQNFDPAPERWSPRMSTGMALVHGFSVGPTFPPLSVVVFDPDFAAALRGNVSQLPGRTSIVEVKFDSPDFWDRVHTALTASETVQEAERAAWTRKPNSDAAVPYMDNQGFPCTIVASEEWDGYPTYATLVGRANPARIIVQPDARSEIDPNRWMTGEN